MDTAEGSQIFAKKTPVRRKSDSRIDLLKDVQFKKESELVNDIARI